MTAPPAHAGLTIGVMARAPIAGRCKTRLAKTLGAESAARIYAAMLADRIAAVDALPAVKRVLLAAPEDDGVAVLGRLAPAGWVILEQRGSDLGERLGNAFRDLLGSGGLVCLVDSDSPLVSFTSLSVELTKPRGPRTVVAGPCEDGGYYLIGMTSLELGILHEIPWSTCDVMPTTRERCRELGLHLEELTEAYDVDESADVDRLERDLREHPARAPATSAALRSLFDRRDRSPSAR
jgi:rSAM/selenodomain-associated transferase 1